MLKDILTYLWDRRTTVFGYAQVGLGYLVATQGLFGDDVMKWLLAANGMLTVMLGHYNNSQIKALRAAAVSNQGGFASPGLLAIIAVVMMVLAACGVMPVAKSYSQKVQVAYATIAVVNDTAAILRNANTISVEDARSVQVKTRKALSAVDAAAVLKPALGEGELASALDLLKAAQDLLCKDRPAEPNCQYLLQRTQL